MVPVVSLDTIGMESLIRIRVFSITALPGLPLTFQEPRQPILKVLMIPAVLWERITMDRRAMVFSMTVLHGQRLISPGRLLLSPSALITWEISSDSIQIAVG